MVCVGGDGLYECVMGVRGDGVVMVRGEMGG